MSDHPEKPCAAKGRESVVHWTLPVEGMSCASRVARVEKALEILPYNIVQAMAPQGGGTLTFSLALPGGE